MPPKKRVSKISKAEIACHHSILGLNLNPINQYRIVGLPRYRFDFYFEYLGKHYLVEYDGNQHFEYTPFINKNIRRWQKNRNHDILKTTVAMLQGYHVIRLDGKSVGSNYQKYIVEGIQSDKRLYVSHPPRYDWLLEAPVAYDRILKYGGSNGPTIINLAKKSPAPSQEGVTG